MKTLMHKIALLIALALFSGNAVQAQELHPKESNVPDVVKQALTSLYPNAKDIEWLKKNRDHEAEFVDNNMSVSILFDKKGNVLNKKTEIDKSEYPAGVSEALKKDFVDHGYKPLSYMKRTEKEDVIYETLLVKGRDLIVVKYDPAGKLLSNVNLTKSLPLDYFPTN